MAPSLIPQKAGDRVTTNRRDAIPWVRLRRSGDLPPVDVPQVADEASRDRSRAREEALRDLKTAKPRLTAFLRRHDSRDTGRATWSPAPRRGRSAIVCPTPAPQMVFQAYVRAVTEPSLWLGRLAQALHAQGQTWRLRPVVDALQARRGVQCTVAVPRVAERGDRARFDTPSQLRRYLGLTPSAYSTGAHRRQGAITKTGNAHARRALIAGAWADRDPANVSRHLQGRLENRPQPLQEISWKAPGRRCQRDRQWRARGKHVNRVGGAIARELSALMWAMAQRLAVPPSRPRL